VTHGDSDTSTLKGTLLDLYVDDQHRVRVFGMVSGIIGGVWTAIWAGIIRLPESLGYAIAAILSPVTSAFENGGDRISNEIRDIGSLWDPFEAGLAGLPLNAAVVLVAFVVLAVGWSRYA
jgi:hypothetical protein